MPRQALLSRTALFARIKELELAYDDLYSMYLARLVDEKCLREHLERLITIAGSQGYLAWKDIVALNDARAALAKGEV